MNGLASGRSMSFCDHRPRGAPSSPTGTRSLACGCSRRSTAIAATGHPASHGCPAAADVDGRGIKADLLPAKVHQLTIAAVTQGLPTSPRSLRSYVRPAPQACAHADGLKVALRAVEVNPDDPSSEELDPQGPVANSKHKPLPLNINGGDQGANQGRSSNFEAPRPPRRLYYELPPPSYRP